MLEQARRFRRDLPIVGIRQAAPPVYMAAQLIDDRRGIVPLLLGRKPFAFVKDDGFLLGSALALSGLWQRRDELCVATSFDDLVGRLALLIQLPVASWVLVRGIEDRVLKKGSVIQKAPDRPIIRLLGNDHVRRHNPPRIPFLEEP